MLVSETAYGPGHGVARCWYQGGRDGEALLSLWQPASSLFSWLLKSELLHWMLILMGNKPLNYRSNKNVVQGRVYSVACVWHVAMTFRPSCLKDVPLNTSLNLLPLRWEVLAFAHIQHLVLLVLPTGSKLAINWIGPGLGQFSRENPDWGFLA